MSIYSRFFGSSIIELITEVFNRLIYAYTTVEYRLEQANKNYSYYKSKYADPILKIISGTQSLNDAQTITYVKDNNECIITRGASDTEIKDTFDFVLLKKEQDVFVDRNIEDINSRLSSDGSSNISFITFDVTFKDDDNKHEEVTETFALNLVKGEKYTQLGNKIDKNVIWYLIKKQYGVCKFGKSYVLHVIDNNVNMFTYILLIR